MKMLTKVSVLCLSAALLAGCNEEEKSTTQETTETTTVEEVVEEVQCANCGTVANIQVMSVSGEGSGAGAAIGAVVGGLLGNQVGGGSGKKVATVVGAVGGAFAGNEVEKRTKTETYYDVTVEMDVGGTRTVSVANASQLSIGDPVRVDGNNIELL